MGVDFYTCAVCGDNFPDCGEFTRCGGCEEVFCGQECAQPKCSAKVCEYDNGHGEYDGCDGCSCVLCRKEKVTDAVLLAFVLSYHRMTREEAVDMYRKAAPAEPAS